jgi:phosphohistidine swiveling domain-containing protein
VAKVTHSYGSKADNLRRLSDAGFNVPAFYVVAANDALKNSGEQQTAFADWTRQHRVQSVAVRSSSTLEDGQTQSFAGQFHTVLDVSGGSFAAALQTVLTSKHSQAYSHKTAKVHAIVQQFIEADISGVIFSVNPASGNNECVINAAAGRGTTVVEGQAAAEYFVDRLDFRRHWQRPGAANISSLDNDLLSNGQIAELCQLALEIERLFGTPQDIEWSIKDGVLYVLQARPITRINHLRVWDSSNIAESFPGIVLPLTFSIAKRGYLLGYKAQAQAAGLSWYDIEANHRTFDSMIAIFNGKLYYNLLHWYRFISLFPGSSRNQKFLDDQIATQGEAVYQPPPEHSLGYRLSFGFRVLRRAIFFNRELAKFYDRFATYEAEMAVMPQANDSQLLMRQFAHIEQTIIPHFGRTLDNDFFVMTYHGWLKKLLGAWLPDKPFERSNIIGSISGVLSAKQALTLYDLAADFKSDPTAHKLLQAADYKGLDRYLAATSLQQSIDAYKSEFGHRFAEDQKIEAVNPVLEEHGLYKLLAAYIQLDENDIRKRLAHTLSGSHASDEKVKQRLNPLRRAIYAILMNRLKHHLRLREKNRLLRGRVYGQMRELFPQVGKALVSEGVLQKWDDIYYLQIEEIYQLLQAALITNDLTERIANRRQAYDGFAKISMPVRFITRGIPSLETFAAIPELSADPAATAKDSDSSSADRLEGLVSSPGTVEGRVIVLHEPKIPDEPYDILVASHTDPGWTPLIALAKGVIVEHGGMLSHAAIVTRELGIPSIIGVKDITKILKTGMRVRINTAASRVEILSD